MYKYFIHQKPKSNSYSFGSTAFMHYNSSVLGHFNPLSNIHTILPGMKTALIQICNLYFKIALFHIEMQFQNDDNENAITQCDAYRIYDRIRKSTLIDNNYKLVFFLKL